MAPEYEARTLEVFARFVEAGLVYKKLKPVPWSVSNQTALADAELEYQDVTDPSVYVEFPVSRITDGEILPLRVLRRARRRFAENRRKISMAAK